MTDFLLLTLYAPFTSWGDIAVGEYRGSWDRPSRSAVLGLIAAALGVDRDDQAMHDAIDQAYGVAVRADVTGSPLVDYQTAQTVDALTVKKRRPATRAELLDTRDKQTILSRRSYWQDALATVALWERAAAAVPRSLGEIADALAHPRFVLYAGRKANAFALPLNPIVQAAATLAEALAMRPSAVEQLDGLTASPAWQVRQPMELEVSHDRCEGFASGLRELRREVRRDAAAHRRRWQFAERVVEVGVMSVEAMA